MKVLLTLFFAVFSLAAFAQVDEGKLREYDPDEEPDRAEEPTEEQEPEPEEEEDRGGFDINRFRLGGGFGFSGGSGFLNVSVSPTALYKFSEYFYAGPGFTYTYLRNDNFNPPVQASIYGPRLIAQPVYENYYGQVMFEAIRTRFPNEFNNALETGWVEGVFVGGGLFTRLGQRGVMIVGLLYNLTYDPGRSPYNSRFLPQFTVLF